MITSDKRIRIITGHYGSGKTEFAVNYAMMLRKLSNKKVALADMDVVNLYFRSRERQQELEEMGIKVISSSIEGGALDLPAVSAEVMGPMEDLRYDYVIDLGGDAVGARAFGRFESIIDREDYDMFMVVNANREQTCDVAGVLKHKDSIEGTTQLRVTGFINNTHLVRETTMEDILRGDRLVKKLQKETNIPVRYVSAMERLASKIDASVAGEVLPLHLMMRAEWM